jgi:hypothetical protein
MSPSESCQQLAIQRPLVATPACIPHAAPTAGMKEHVDDASDFQGTGTPFVALLDKQRCKE